MGVGVCMGVSGCRYRFERGCRYGCEYMGIGVGVGYVYFSVVNIFEYWRCRCRFK